MKVLYTPLTLSDSEEFYRLAGDERVARTMRFSCPRSREESDRVLAEYLSGGSRAFALRSPEDGRLWGVFAFKPSDTPGGACLSQMQLPEQWGRGLGSRVVRDMTALARKNKWYRVLEGYILETNTASRRMAERNGFSEADRFRFEGMTEDLILYRLEL